MENLKIDFVLPWVDDSDPVWQQEFDKYTPGETYHNTKARFRDWDNLHYIFRAFESFTPWVNKVFLITYGHLPKWLKTDHKKLVVVNHQDYIDKKHLPVFSSHPLEINLHRIEGLSDHFVYFNDDTFLLQPLGPEIFFKDNLPVDYAILDTQHDGLIAHIVLNDIDLINKNFNRHVDKNFSKKQIVFNNFGKWFSPKYGLHSLKTLFLLYWKGHTGFAINHHPQPFLKKTFAEVWSRENVTLEKVSSSKFRSNDDVNQYLFRYWQLVAGDFTPAPYTKIINSRKRCEVRTLNDAKNVANDITSSNYEMYCINDATSKGRYTPEDISEEDFKQAKQLINSALEKTLPNKSRFEK